MRRSESENFGPEYTSPNGIKLTLLAKSIFTIGSGEGDAFAEVQRRNIVFSAPILPPLEFDLQTSVTVPLSAS